MTPLFITVEGVEGVGKSTILHFITQYLQQHQIAFTATREPGGTMIAERLRRVILEESAEALTPEAELLLMFAGRVQHMHHVIRPALERGEWVVSDRFIDASYAYQGAGRGVAFDHIDYLVEWLKDSCEPTLTLLLDAPPEVTEPRLVQRGKRDRIESEELVFFERVREAYLARAAHDPTRMKVIDASQPLPAVQEEVKAYIQALEGNA